jgi:alanine adding enzyme
VLEFCELLEEEFDAYAAEHINGSFCQSSKMGKLRKTTGFKVFYYGVKDSEQNKLLAAACLTIREPSNPLFGILKCLHLEKYFKLMLSKFNIYHQRAEIYGGPLVNSNLSNAEEEKLWYFFMQKLKEVAVRAGVSKLYCNPNIVFQHLDLCGNFVEGGELNKEFMKNLGFYEIAPISPAFHYKKNLKEYTSPKELLNSYAPKTRAEIRSAQNNCLSIRALEKSDLVVFDNILKATGQRQGFSSRGLEYYEAFYDAFTGEDIQEDGESAQFLAVEVDFSKLYTYLSEKKEQLIHEIEKYSNNSKKTGAKRELENQLKAVENKLEKYNSELAEGATFPICAGLFICSNHEMVYLFGGSLTEYMDLKAVYFLVSKQLEDAYNKGLGIFNFYGVGPNFETTAPEYGVLAFKQGFGGYIDELIGEWVMHLL